MPCLFGVSVPWFFGNYGYDLAPNPLSGLGPRYVDPMELYRPVLQARELGYRAVRIWLCESAEGILMSDGAITGLHPVLIESVATIQEAVALCGLRVYWTLLDAHSWKRTRDQVTGAILTTPDETASFAEKVVAPLVRFLDPRLTVAIEVVNEPEALTSPGGSSADETAQWQNYGLAIKTIAAAIRAERPEALVTAGTDWRSLGRLWELASGLDAVDIHVKGIASLPSRAEILNLLRIPSSQASSIPMIAGCLDGNSTVTDDSAYSAIFQWRLRPER